MSILREFKDLLRNVKELIAVLHWFSNLITLLTAISEHGTIEGLMFWLIIGLISAVVSELIQTLIPSYLRPLLKYLF